MGLAKSRLACHAAFFSGADEGQLEGGVLLGEPRPDEVLVPSGGASPILRPSSFPVASPTGLIDLKVGDTVGDTAVIGQFGGQLGSGSGSGSGSALALAWAQVQKMKDSH